MSHGCFHKWGAPKQTPIHYDPCYKDPPKKTLILGRNPPHANFARSWVTPRELPAGLHTADCSGSGGFPCRGHRPVEALPKGSYVVPFWLWPVFCLGGFNILPQKGTTLEPLGSQLLPNNFPCYPPVPLLGLEVPSRSYAYGPLLSAPNPKLL